MSTLDKLNSEFMTGEMVLDSTTSGLTLRDKDTSVEEKKNLIKRLIKYNVPEKFENEKPNKVSILL